FRSVSAETTDPPTKLAKIVVTDDRGRYLVPDLPKGNYTVWARGYGLIDGPKVKSVPGKIVNLTATIAPNAKAAAEYYPASYWYSLLQVPAKSEFPGTGPGGNGISPNIKSQAQLLDLLKTDRCWSCHQLGPKAYLHDEIATDKRNPTVNAHGLLYGSPELSTDNIPVLDPVLNTATTVRMPVRDPKTAVPNKPVKPSVFWGEEAIWDSQANM